MKRRAASMRIALTSALGFCLLAAAQCGSRAEALTCHSPQQPKQIVQLLFGRDIGHKLGVSEVAWARFVVREMTPRFPDGLTITEAIGQWRDPAAGTIVREPAERVEIVLPGNDDDEARLAAIVTAYKREFRQHSVIVIVRSACVSF
jgi:Protein of unknown function (DUF3574)